MRVGASGAFCLGLKMVVQQDPLPGQPGLVRTVEIVLGFQGGQREPDLFEAGFEVLDPPDGEDDGGLRQVDEQFRILFEQKSIFVPEVKVGREGGRHRVQFTPHPLSVKGFCAKTQTLALSR